jgi:VWFA-related protein
MIATGAIAASVFASMLAGIRPVPAFRPVLAQAPGQDEPFQRPPVFRGGTTFVSVDVYPRQDGRVIEGLTKDDFEVIEDGKAQTVETFQFIKYETALVDDERRDPTSFADSERQAADPRNRLFVVYLDPYSIEIDAIDVKSTVMTFLERTIGARDLFGVMTPEMQVSTLTFGRRLETVEDDLDQFWREILRDGQKKDWPRTPFEMKMTECVYGDSDAFRALARVFRQDILLTNLENLAARLAGLREERTNILFISAGWMPVKGNERITAGMRRPTVPQIGTGPTGRLGIGNQQPYSMERSWCDQQLARLASIDFEQRFHDLVIDARQGNVTFHPVDVSGLEVDDGGLLGPAGTLKTLAENTDGLAIVNTNDVVGAVRRLTNSLAGMYLLGYYSGNPTNDGRYREIRVRVKRPNVEVSARQGYFAPTAAMVAAAERAAANPPAPPTAVDEELARLARARPEAELFAYATTTGQELLITAELSSREMESGRWRLGAEVKATVQPASGGGALVGTSRIDSGARVTTLTVPTSGTTGPWKVDLKISRAGDVLDSSTSVSHPVGPLFADPVLFRANPSPRAPLRPVADFQYRRSERVRVEWRTLKAVLDRQSRLLDSKGQALPLTVALSERDDGGVTTVIADLNLAPLIEGNYVIELTGSAGTETQRALVAFKVVR